MNSVCPVASLDLEEAVFQITGSPCTGVHLNVIEGNRNQLFGLLPKDPRHTLLNSGLTVDSTSTGMIVLTRMRLPAFTTSSLHKSPDKSTVKKSFGVVYLFTLLLVEFLTS